MSESRTEINDLGEFGLIDHLGSGVEHYHKSTQKGIGDDAAVVEAGDHFSLLTSDMLVEGVHFDLSYVPLHHLGYKAAVVNFSDVAAMNGVPRQMLVSIGLSNRFSVEAVDALYAGLKAACKHYKVDLVGGDTCASHSGLILSITVMGEAGKDRVAYRSGAGEKDILCVTGDLGASYMGLQVLEREKQVFLTDPEMQPDLEKYKYAVGKQLKPEARTDIVYELKEKGIRPTSMIDLSDGLASDLMHICQSSKIGARVFEDKLPFDPETEKIAGEFKIDTVTAMLNGGEDYELLFTISQEDHEKIMNIPDVQMIGYVSKDEQGPVLVTRSENVVPITAQGWNHFSKKED